MHRHTAATVDRYRAKNEMLKVNGGHPVV